MAFWLPPGSTSARRLLTADRLGRSVDCTASQGVPIVPSDEFQAEALRQDPILQERAGIPWLINESKNPVAGFAGHWGGYAGGGTNTAVPSYGINDGPAGTGITTCVEVTYSFIGLASTSDMQYSASQSSADVSNHANHTAYVGGWIKFVSKDGTAPTTNMMSRSMQANGTYITNSTPTTPVSVSIGTWYYTGAYATIFPGAGPLGWGSPMSSTTSTPLGGTQVVRLTGAVFIINPPAGLPTGTFAAGTLSAQDLTEAVIVGGIGNTVWEGAANASRSVSMQ